MQNFGEFFYRKHPREQYKGFSKQYIECRANGTLFRETCINCGQELLLCRKYGGQCISWKCREERYQNREIPLLLSFSTVLLPGTIAPGWKLLQPLLVVILPEDNGDYLAYDRFNVYGYGRTQEEAQQDYITALTEYYQVLADKTDSPTQALFQRLQSYLQRESENTENIEG